MAAIETPWITDMTHAATSGSDDLSGKAKAGDDPNPPSTFAVFSPTSATFSPTTKQRSTILVHRKSPLLVATPPAVTRALAFSHPFILPLNYSAGLLTWSTGDPWESFLLVAAFWSIVLYGEDAIRYAGPLMLVLAIIFGMYSRRYSPLSSTIWTGEKNPSHPESNTKHQKSLDEILDTLNTFTTRCNVLLDPFLQLTDFLSTQRTATSATTRPALTSLFIRILFVTPFWIALTFKPLSILTTRRVVLAVGTMILSWHSRPARVSRTILWRSISIRQVLSFVTGLEINVESSSTKSSKGKPPPLPARNKSQNDFAHTAASNVQAESSGVRFTFVVFENQRRWLGLGWTSTMLAYERAAWTDEHLNASASKDDFELPSVENERAQWRWVKGSEWQIEGSKKGKASSESDGWIYYDNRWDDGRRGQDGWGRYTRRRKWYRDAELVELKPGENALHVDGPSDVPDSSHPPSNITAAAAEEALGTATAKDSDSTHSSQNKHRRSIFRRRSNRTSTPTSSDFSSSGGASAVLRDGSATVVADDEEGPHLPLSHQHQEGELEIGDDMKMGMG